MYRINYFCKDGHRYGYDLDSGFGVLSHLTRVLCEFFQDDRTFSSISVYSYRSREIIIRIKF